MQHLYKYLILFIGIFSFTGQSELLAQNNCANALELTVNVNDCINETVSNLGVGTSGVVPTTCAGYSGGDLWLSAVLPPSGEITFTARIIPGVTNLAMDINMAAYIGSCGSLTQVACDLDSGPGLYPQIIYSGTPGSTIYFQLWDVGNNQQSDFAVCVNGTPTCASPSATFTEVCAGNNQFEVNVNITGLGDATELNILNNGGAAAINGITSTGVQTVGPFDFGTPVVITVEHAEDATCNLEQTVSDVGLGCENTITCGSDLTENYCYGNNETSVFLYSSSNGSDITLEFNSGLIQNGADQITIRDGDNASAPILFQGSNGGNLAGLSRTGTSGSIYMSISSDVGGSCQEGSLGLGGGWEWVVSCEGISACDAAVTLISQTTFAASEVSANLSGVPFSGVSQCAGSGSNPDLYFSFTAVGSVTYFRARGTGDFNPVVEVYDACGGTQLACVNDAPAGQRELFWVTDLTPGEDYVYRVYHAGPGAPSNTAFQTAIAHIPTVQLRQDFCGATGLTANSIIRATQPNPNFLLDGFVWEFTELEAPFNTYIVNSPNGANPQFRIWWFTDYEYGRSYSVRVAARMYQGPNVGDFGPACTITLASETGSALQPQYNNGFFQLCDIIKAVPVPGTVNYRWTFNDGSNTLEYNSNSSNYFLPLQNVQGLQLGTSYTVNVFTTNSNGNESTSSIDRTINMQGSVPNTALNPAFINCGSTIAITQGTQAFNVCAATGYTFRFTNLSQPDIDPIEAQRNNRSIFFNTVPGLIQGDTYSVAVRASAGGLTGDYSTTCEITFAAASSGNNFVSNPSAIAGNTTAPSAQLSVYPNPVVNNEIMVQLVDLQDAQQQITVAIFDLTGKLMVQENFGNNGSMFNARMTFNGNLAAGVYILQTNVNGNVLATERLVVQ